MSLKRIQKKTNEEQGMTLLLLSDIFTEIPKDWRHTRHKLTAELGEREIGAKS